MLFQNLMYIYKKINDFNRSIDIYEWHNFLTPRLKLARLFRAKQFKKVRVIKCHVLNKKRLYIIYFSIFLDFFKNIHKFVLYIHTFHFY